MESYNRMNVKVLLKHTLKKFAKNQTFRVCSLFFKGLKATFSAHILILLLFSLVRARAQGYTEMGSLQIALNLRLLASQSRSQRLHSFWSAPRMQDRGT